MHDMTCGEDLHRRTLHASCGWPLDTVEPKDGSSAPDNVTPSACLLSVCQSYQSYQSYQSLLFICSLWQFPRCLLFRVCPSVLPLAFVSCLSVFSHGPGHSRFSWLIRLEKDDNGESTLKYLSTWIGTFRRCSLFFFGLLPGRCGSLLCNTRTWLAPPRHIHLVGHSCLCCM